MVNFKNLRIASVLLASTALASRALAQQVDLQPPPRETIDPNGVDLALGKLTVSSPAISIGAGDQGLSWSRALNVAAAGTGWGNPYKYALYGSTSSVQAVFGEQSVNFNFNSSTGAYDNQQGTGETLTQAGTTWTLTLHDGTVATLDDSDFSGLPDPRYGGTSVLAVAHTIVRPNKEKLILAYRAVENSADTKSWVRLQSLQSTNGFMAKPEYANNGSIFATGWQSVTKVTLLNSAVDYCNPSADICSYSTSWPTLTFTYVTGAQPEVDTVTDTLSRSTVFTFGYLGNGNGKLVGIRRPTSATDDVTAVYDANGRVQSVAIDGRTWTYSWSLASPLMTATVIGPDTTQKVYITNTTTNQMTSYKDELNHTTTYQYDTFGRPTDIIYPEGNKLHYTYDARGNVTEARAISKTPGTPADIVKSAAYPSTCTNALTCNEPTSITDPRNNVTDYTYDATHGGVVTVTSPAPTTGAVRPQTRYGYTALQAYYKNSGGSIVASGQPTYLLTSTSACQTLGSCAGLADEVKASIAYGPQVSGTANNLLPVSLSKGSGDGALTATTAATYDNIGNATYIDGPLSGTADTTRTIYDAGRQTVGQISPDPDGGGALPNRAVRLTYNADGQVTKSEHGTTAGQTDSAWAAFAPAEFIDTAYDASGRKTTETLKNGSTSYALTQNSYDSVGRLDCTAVRMNTAVYGSLPSACTLSTQGSYGPDQITQTAYDAASEPTQAKLAVGTSDAATERTLTYSSNGRLATLLDGESNLTTYEYDGFDRLLKTRYPSTTKGSDTSSTTDYEQLGYDANSNITSLRIRDGNSIAFTYDNLNRPTFKDLPGSEPDVTYTYDNLNRLLGASVPGYAAGFVYDALGRKITEGGIGGQRYSQYDLAGRRTRLTHYDGFYVDYDYLVTGEVSAIRENGATSGVGVLATYGYDNLGNRTSVTFGNGAAQAFSYDPVSRLAALTNDLSGTTNDLSVTFAYSPASQITSTTRTGDAYAWTGHGSGSTATVTNGLNELTSVGGVSAAYDAKGNLTTDPVTGRSNYFYTSENLLREPGYGVGYDSLNRLLYVGTSEWIVDGDDPVAEYVGSGFRRYVLDPDGQPVVWYEGTGTTDRRFLSEDERGSVVSATDASGTLVGINSYDEYGKPGASNVGRFGFTGQMWIPEYSLNYFHARFYAPHLGRFMQTDPIGPEDDANLYAYALDDPVDFDDPLGLQEAPGCTGFTNCLPVYVVATLPGNGGGGAGASSGNGSFGGEAQRGCFGGCNPIRVIAPHIKRAWRLFRRMSCNFGNTLESWSNGTSQVSVVVGTQGAIAVVVGWAGENPVILGYGAGSLSVSGGAGIISGLFQLTGGLYQGISGHGFGNTWKALGSFGTSAVLSAGIGRAVPRRFVASRAPGVTSRSALQGNFTAYLQQISTSLAPTQVQCN